MNIITVRQLGGIGDCLMLTPALLGLREKYRRAKIWHVTGSVYLGGALMDIFTHMPKGIVDEIHPMEPYDATTLRTREVWGKYYAQCPPLEDELWWSWADKHFDFNTPCVDYEWVAMKSPEGIQKSRTQIWCDYAGVTPSTQKPLYIVTPQEQAWAEAYYRERGLDPGKVIGVGATACDNKRAVGQGTLHTVCDKLKAEGFTPVVIDPTFHFNDHPAFNGHRISELMALVQRMKLVISVDSGLLHMAGAQDVPVVGIFGPTDHKMRMGPYIGTAIDSRKLMPCAPCWYEYPCTQSKDPRKHFECLNKISADIIVEQAIRWTRGGGLRVVQ
jgi:ADP-heptose:LPS heptosyltransferase